MIPAIIKLRGDVNELQEQVAALQALELRDLLTTDDRFDILSAKLTMLEAHVENLIDRVADLEGVARPKRAWERPEPTSTDTPVSRPPAG